jgi:hypothetical protein
MFSTAPKGPKDARHSVASIELKKEKRKKKNSGEALRFVKARDNESALFGEWKNGEWIWRTRVNRPPRSVGHRHLRSIGCQAAR